MRRCGQGQALTVPEMLRRLKDPAALDPTVTSGVISRMASTESPTLNARTVQHNAAMWWSRASGYPFEPRNPRKSAYQFAPLSGSGLLDRIADRRWGTVTMVTEAGEAQVARLLPTAMTNRVRVELGAPAGRGSLGV